MEIIIDHEDEMLYLPIDVLQRADVIRKRDGLAVKSRSGDRASASIITKFRRFLVECADTPDVMAVYAFAGGEEMMTFGDLRDLAAKFDHMIATMARIRTVVSDREEAPESGREG